MTDATSPLKIAICDDSQADAGYIAALVQSWSGGRPDETGAHEALLGDEGGKYHALWHAQAILYRAGRKLTKSRRGLRSTGARADFFGS